MSRWRWSGGFPLRASPPPSSLPDLNGLTVVSLSLPQGTEAIKSDSGSLGHLKGLTRTHSHTPVTACRNIVSHLHCTPLGCWYAPRLVHIAAESVSTEGEPSLPIAARTAFSRSRVTPVAAPMLAVQIVSIILFRLDKWDIFLRVSLCFNVKTSITALFFWKKKENLWNQNC